ncbi:MAG: response regulator [Pseudomonadota bacterium]
MTMSFPQPTNLLTPYFHPTTACFVDDNESFLTGLDMVLPRYMRSIAFFDPSQALEFVNRPPATPALADRAFQVTNRKGTDFAFDLDVIEQEIRQVQRFSRISVVFVDYSMPTIDGLEFCESITDRSIGRVLLTGVADEKTAVAAFNAGIIDRFISKSHPRATQDLTEFSVSMQHEYFKAQCLQMKRTLALSGVSFLDDPEIAEFVHRLMEERGFCEYYLLDEPPGLMLVTPQGSVAQLLILSAEECAAQLAFARQHGAPWMARRRLERGTHVGYFLEGVESYDISGGEPYPWAQLIHRAQTLGASNWRVALIEQPAVPIDYSEAETSYNGFVAGS